MKKVLHTLFLLLFVSIDSDAQIVINEIMYNPPESGVDSLEYIDIYNAGSAAFDLTDCKFTDGVKYTFGSVSIASKSSICIAVDSVAMQVVFGKTCYQWDTNEGLRNGGELVKIVDATGATLDEVEFGNAAPWPSSADGTNGSGGSIVLCDPAADNSLGANWSVALNNIGVEINGFIVKGSPAENNDISCQLVPDHIINATVNNVFSPKDITINVGEIVQWKNVGGGFHNVNGSKTQFPDNPESFGNGQASTDDWTYTYTFLQSGVYRYQCDPHAGINMVGSITVGTPKNYQKVDISALRPVNANGVPTNINGDYEIEGVVHGVNFHPANGLSIYVIDDTHDGINIFNPTSTLDYNVNEGDLISVKGTLGQFNGLTQLNADIISLEGSGALQNPIKVQTIDESVEAKLVVIENAELIDPSEWRGNGSSFNVRIHNSVDTFTVRINAQTNLSTEPAPTKAFNIIGLVNQFDFTEPFDGFYQLFPRYKDDLQLINNTDNALLTNNVKVYPNPTSGFVHIDSDRTLQQVCVYNTDGKLINVWKNPSTSLSIDLPEGLYILSIDDATTVQYQKLVIRK